jgi:tRNA-2-methylthio-N6-dimethylallyladenosine synthase
LVKKIRRAIPDILFSTDVIVGFPGETKAQFNNTVKTLKEIGYGVAFINKYSPRSGTAAAKLKDDVPWREKKRREKVLTEILKQTTLEKNKKIIGKTLRVLVDSKKGYVYFGKSEGYKTVKIIQKLKLKLYSFPLMAKSLIQNMQRRSQINIQI